MSQKSSKADNYGIKESNPFLWELSKKIKNQSRYVVNLILLAIAVGVALYGINQIYLPMWAQAVISVALLLLAISLRIAFEWERVPVLRLGKYVMTRGPGPFLIVPILDQVVDYIDCRIMVTDFSAEKVLTKDTVPVYVDALIFWMVWDASKASLEVENYKRAVALSAKTALRDIIGQNSLSTLLNDRDGIGEQLQKILDHKTNPWGITSHSVEIKDIIIPSGLEDAMSREAQAEREKNARVILSTAELEIADNFAKASEKYKGNDAALQLRSLNILMEALKKNGSMILVPSDSPNLMNIATAAGVAKKQKD